MDLKIRYKRHQVLNDKHVFYLIQILSLLTTRTGSGRKRFGSSTKFSRLKGLTKGGRKGQTNCQPNYLTSPRERRP